MSITKKKRTMIFISVSALLVLAAVAGFLTWWIKVGSRTVTETAELPPAVPDSVQYWKGKEKHSLSEQDEQTVYNTLVEALAKCEKTDTYLMPYTDKHTNDFLKDDGWFVLQYSEIYKFTGTFPDELLYLQTFEQKEFDSIVFWPSGYYFEILLFCEGDCTNRCYTALRLPLEDAKILVKTLQEVLSHYDFEKPAWASWEIE